MQEYSSRVAYCIPLLANSAICYDVSIQQTPEMQKEAGSMLCLERNRFRVDIFCSTWLVTHLCSAGPGQASRRARGPVLECFMWNLMSTPFKRCFQACGAGTWQESCWMNVGSQRGSASWSGRKGRRKWATPAQCCWTRSLAAFRGLELGSWVSLPSRVMAVQSRGLVLWACHIQELGFVQ